MKVLRTGNITDKIDSGYTASQFNQSITDSLRSWAGNNFIVKALM